MRKLIIQSTLLVLASLLVEASYSQKNFLPGYIVSITGDTIHGFVDYRNWDKNPKSISFKSSSGDEIINYPVMGIKRFHVLDERYESAIVRAESSPYQLDQLGYDKELNFRTDTIFLQAIIEGDKSLYYYKDKNAKEHFYIRSGAEFELLVHKKYLREEDGKDMVKTNKKYIDQLNLYFNECSTLREKAYVSEYKKKNLEKLFSLYYKCTKTGVSFKKKERMVTEMGFLAGASMTSLSFISSDAQFVYVAAADYKKSINFSGGIFFDAVIARNQGKWSINNELFLTSYKIKGRYNDYENENKYTYYDLTMGHTYIKMNNMIRFRYPVAQQLFYINAGISNGIAISEINDRKTESKFYTTEKTEKDKVLNDTRKYEQGFILGLGTKVRKFSFEARYEQGNGMSEYRPLKTVSKRFHFLFGFRL